MKIAIGNWALAAALLVALVVGLIVTLSDDQARFFLGETGIIERGTAFFYVVAALSALMLATRTRGFLRLFAIGWMLLSVMAFGEETSWLQHEIGYATPEAIAERNVQGEFNFHNLQGLHGGKLLESDSSAPALGGLASVQNLFQAGFLFFFLLVPFLAVVPAVRRLYAKLPIAYPGWRIVVAVWLPVVAAIALAFPSHGTVKDLAAETRELLYAMSFALFLSAWLFALRTERHDAFAAFSPTYRASR